MTIKTQQRLLLVVIGIISVTMFGIVAQSNRVIEQYQARSLLLTLAIKEVFEFNIAAGDYLLDHQDRPLEQMGTRLGSLATSLGAIRFNHTDGLAVLSDMLQELERAGHLFKRLKSTHEAFHSEDGGGIPAKIDPFGHQEIEDLSRSLSITSMALVHNANNLLKSSAEKQAEEIRFYGRLVLGGLVISFGLLAVSVLIFSRRFVRTIENLKVGTARIARGDLTTRVEVSGSDELAEHTRLFNEMSERLQASHTELEDEIEERKRSEESLLESEQLLLRNEDDIKKLNKALEQQLLKLQEANREMESFTYSVSHDLRAPLRHMAGFVELLERRDISGLDEKSRHYLKVISDSSKKMGCLIDDLLTFSRMGRGEMMKNSVDLQQLTREVIAEISNDIPSGNLVQWRIGDLPPVSGDRAMLRLVLVNLISNAVKFTGHVSAPLIEVDVLPSKTGFHTLYVRDNGAGFDMKYVDKLFGLFQRLHSTEEYEGTGVGLANVRRIIGRHGGRTWAEGELDRGASFYFTLPISEVTGKVP